MRRARARPSPTWRRLVRTPVGAVCLGSLALLVAVALLAPVLLGERAATIDTDALRQGMSGEHWLGTDALGRDVFTRVLVATRLTLTTAFMAASLGALMGIVLGALPTMVGGRLGRLIVSCIDILVAFPGLLLALFLAVVFGVGTQGAVLAIGVAFAPAFARLTHNLSTSVSGSDYVAAARILGVRRFRLVTRHVLPNVAEPLVITATLAVGAALLSLAGLSFLGFGVQPPSYDWGRLLNEGLGWIYVNPAAALAPGIAVVFAGIAFNLLGDAAARAVGEGTAATSVRRAPGHSADHDPAPDPTRPEDKRVLHVDGLSVCFPLPDGESVPVSEVSLSVAEGEIVGVVGESGSGKSLMAAGIADLVPYPGFVDAGRIEVLGCDLTRMAANARSRLLGRTIAIVFQDPNSALNPALRVGRQLAEVAQVRGAARREAWRLAVDRLRAVRIPAPERRARQYPHQYSGGMRQRAAIGMGLMADPRLIIADEPTTALDMTVQRQILTLLRRIRDERGTAVLLISHDVGVIAELADRVLVMYAGRVVEDLPASALHDDARHPYTAALVASVPDLATDREQPLATIPGRPPEPTALPPGCAYAPRCPRADELCRVERPPLTTANGHRLACWHPLEGRGADTGQVPMKQVAS